jgi:hypothetical protein
LEGLRKPPVPQLIAPWKPTTSAHTHTREIENTMEGGGEPHNHVENNSKSNGSKQ